jgi:hypothetical protein
MHYSAPVSQQSSYWHMNLIAVLGEENVILLCENDGTGKHCTTFILAKWCHKGAQLSQSIGEIWAELACAELQYNIITSPMCMRQRH